MSRCDQCGNDYDKAFDIVKDDRRWTFDSFECAIQTLAPICPHCQCRVIGHGVEEGGVVFCCVHCAKQDGSTALRDRV